MLFRQFKLGKKIIGDYANPFIIAEAGVNHSGDFKAARDMVEVAAKFGVDAVSILTRGIFLYFRILKVG